jgi:hypothetical protein
VVVAVAVEVTVVTVVEIYRYILFNYEYCCLVLGSSNEK